MNHLKWVGVSRGIIDIRLGKKSSALEIALKKTYFWKEVVLDTLGKNDFLGLVRRVISNLFIIIFPFIKWVGVFQGRNSVRPEPGVLSDSILRA